MRRLLTVAGAVACFGLLGAADASAQSAQYQTPNQDYVAMGDSYSAGNGTGNYYESSCDRSVQAYGPLISKAVNPTTGTIPGTIGMVMPAARDVLVQIVSDDLGPEVAALSGSTVQQEIIGHVAQLVAEPVVDRDAEPHLLPSQDRLGEHAPHDAFHQVLLRQSPELEAGRERRGELHDPVVEEG